MKIRILSDLHLDINYNYPLEYNDDVFTIIAGDTAGVIEEGIEWIRKNNLKGACIAGNHLVYNYYNKSITDLKEWLKGEFPKNSDMSFLDNDYIFVPNTNNGVAIIGSTFYTDYRYHSYDVEQYNKRQMYLDTMSLLYGIPTKSEPAKKLTSKMILDFNMLEAKCGLNDFTYGYVENNVKLTPEDYLKMHNKSKSKIKKCVNEILNINPNCKIILVTHHCLSPKCLSSRYVSSMLNGSYVSELENWADKELPNLRLIVSGHIHNRNDFTFGENNIRYITNPRGYVQYGESDGDKPFNPNLIIDTDEL